MTTDAHHMNPTMVRQVMRNKSTTEPLANWLSRRGGREDGQWQAAGDESVVSQEESPAVPVLPLVAPSLSAPLLLEQTARTRDAGTSVAP